MPSGTYQVRSTYRSVSFIENPVRDLSRCEVSRYQSDNFAKFCSWKKILIILRHCNSPLSIYRLAAIRYMFAVAHIRYICCRKFDMRKIPCADRHISSAQHISKRKLYRKSRQGFISMRSFALSKRQLRNVPFSGTYPPELPLPFYIRVNQIFCSLWRVLPGRSLCKPFCRDAFRRRF